MAPSKRKMSDAGADSKRADKRGRSDSQQYHPNSKEVEDFGIILRDFYPPEVCSHRATILTRALNLILPR